MNDSKRKQEPTSRKSPIYFKFHRKNKGDLSSTENHLDLRSQKIRLSQNSIANKGNPMIRPNFNPRVTTCHGEKPGFWKVSLVIAAEVSC